MERSRLHIIIYSSDILWINWEGSSKALEEVCLSPSSGEILSATFGRSAVRRRLKEKGQVEELSSAPETYQRLEDNGSEKHA